MAAPRPAPDAPIEETERWPWILSGAAGIAERLLLVGLVAGVVTVLYLSTTLEADGRGFGTHEQLGLKPCTFKSYTSYPCMTCGMTTSFTHMAHLEFGKAFSVQPAGAILFLLSVAFVPLALWAAVRGRSLLIALERTPARWFGIPLLVVLLGGWLYTALRYGG